MKKILYVILLIVFTATLGCNRKLSIDDIVVTSRLFSPDSSYIAISYYVDNGAMGQSLTMTTLLKSSDTTDFINEYNFPCFDLSFYSCYHVDHWLSNDTLQVFLNERPFIKEGIPFDSSSFIHNGIFCKVKPNDYSYDYSPLIQHFSFSEDRKKLLVTYRYKGVSELNISVIKYEETLPRYGNVFTNYEICHNPFEIIKWDGESIDMYLNEASKYRKSDYLNKGIDIDVNFVNVGILNRAKVNNLKSIYNKLYEDELITEYLYDFGIQLNAVILNNQWNIINDQSNFYYEYEYQLNGEKYRSYFRIFKDFDEGRDYEDGDTITLIVDPNQAVIHMTENKYSR